MNTQFTNQQKPTLVNVIAWMTLGSGIVNLFWGLGLALTGLLSIIGILCIPILILPTVLGVFEIIYAAKLMSNPPQAIQPSTTLAILEIVCILVGNVFSVVVGILALVFYNDLTVRDYFARLNGALVADTPLPPAAPILDPVPSPAVEPDARLDPLQDESPLATEEEIAPFEEPRSPEDETPKS